MKTDIHNLKEGDCIICKSSRYSYNEVLNDNLINLKNKKYIILSIVGDRVFVSNQKNSSDVFYTIEKNNFNYYLFDHFYTIKQYRKLKLKKLSQTR